MAEGRDRLTRQEDPIEVYTRRRTRSSIGRGSIEILEDESPSTGTPAAATRGGTGRIGSPRNRRGRTPARVIGRQNISPTGHQGRNRGRHSVLPSWYPRTPLRDITSIVRAIERTRARLRESEGGEQLESVVPQDHTVPDPSESTSGAQLDPNDPMLTPGLKTRSRYYPKSTSGAQLDPNDPMLTPGLQTRSRYYPKSVGKVPKILLDITNQKPEAGSSGASDCLTPGRKLLDSIETVEKDVKEELHKLKRTPSARKQEREKRVKTLMSMR
ncbi:protein POLYCHOME-like isoform X1 [Lycium barbarum]|uniref:protein POLYCHOME-like isoform X1 n=1 Tax=Lycium barbarum TaxID=112863 RepID=UPI00293F52B0|nr:protein POLYCHOME-like isoform X1 [Lycium barbarum]